MGTRKGDSLSLGRGETKAMVSSPAGNSSDSGLNERMQGVRGRASGIDCKIFDIEGRTNTTREGGSNVIDSNKEKSSTKDTTLRDTFKLGERVGQRITNTDTERTSRQKIAEKYTHITTNAKRTEGTQDMETPGGIKSLLNIKENSKDMQPGRKGLTNERLKPDQRIQSRQSKAKTKLKKGKEGTGLKKPHKTGINHTLEQLTKTARKSDRAIIRGKVTRLQRLEERKDESQGPLRGEETRRPQGIVESKKRESLRGKVFKH